MPCKSTTFFLFEQIDFYPLKKASRGGGFSGDIKNVNKVLVSNYCCTVLRTVCLSLSSVRKSVLLFAFYPVSISRLDRFFVQFKVDG